MQVKCQNGTAGAEAPTVPTSHFQLELRERRLKPVAYP